MSFSSNKTAPTNIDLTSSQTLTNKTLTSPVVNTPAVTGGTIDSAAITDGTITTPTISNPVINGEMTGTAVDKLPKGGADTIHLVKAYSDGIGGMGLGSTATPLPDFTDTVSNIFKFNVTSAGALMTNDSTAVYILGGASSAAFDAFGTSRAINAGQRGKDILISMLYRTIDIVTDSTNGQFMLWVVDDTNSVQTTTTSTGSQVAGTSIVVGTSTGMSVGEKIWVGHTGGTDEVVETHITAIADATHVTLADDVNLTSGDRLATGVLTDILTTFDAADDDTNQTGTTKKIYVRTADTTASISILWQKLDTTINTGLYFDNILISDDPFQKVETIQTYPIIEKIPAVNLTAGDNSALQFDNLVIGDEYELTGQAHIETFSTATTGFAFFSGAGSTGTLYGRVEKNNGNAVTLVDVVAVSIKFTAVSTTMYTNKFGPNGMAANGTKSETFLQLQATPQKDTAIIVESANPLAIESYENLSNTTTTSSAVDIADLTFTGLTIGKEYLVTGQVRLQAFSGTDNQIRYGSASLNSGDIYGSTVFRVDEANLAQIQTAVSFTFVATSTEMYSYKTGPNNIVGNGTRERTYLQIRSLPETPKPLYALPTVTVGQNAESYVMSATTGNFWDATGDTYQFDTSLLPLTNSLLVEYNDTTQTRVVAKARIKIHAFISSEIVLGNAVAIYTSDGTRIALEYDNANGYFKTATASLVVDAGDYIYFRSENANSRAGGLNLLVEPELGQQNHAAIISAPVAYIKDHKASGTNGGTFTQSVWQTRDLNTLSGDIAAVGVTLSSNQFILPAGKYDIDAIAPAMEVDGHKAKLYNITDSVDVIVGSNESSPAALSSVVTNSLVKGVFTITKITTFELQHRCQTTQASNGYGVQTNISIDEIYTQVKITRKS